MHRYTGPYTRFVGLLIMSLNHSLSYTRPYTKFSYTRLSHRLLHTRLISSPRDKKVGLYGGEIRVSIVSSDNSTPVGDSR